MNQQATDHANNKAVAISVVMTTFNGGKYLEAQLNSIVAQTVKPAEIIVCDDCSTDDTSSILDRFGQQHPFIRYVVNDQRLGVTENFKKAVSFARTLNYIALSDQDDVWLPDKLEKLYTKLHAADNGRQPAMAYSDLSVINDRGELLNNSFWNELGQDTYRHCFDTLLFGNFVTGCTILMNRKMRDEFAHMPPGVLMHDAWLALLGFSKGCVVSIEEPLVLYRRHETNLLFHTKTARKKNKFQKLLSHGKRVITKNDWLGNEIEIAKMFRDQYSETIPADKLRTMDRFLQLANASYLRKMIAFRSCFRSYWLRK